MKNGLWIGGLVLALFVWGSELIAEDVQWRAVEGPPTASAPGIALGQPTALKGRLMNASAPPAPLPGGIVPVGYEVQQTVAKPPSQPAPEIIAVSAPVAPPAPLPPADDEESSETEFAAERRLRPVASSGPPLGAIKRTSAPVPSAADTEPNWNANWSSAPLGGPGLDGAAAVALPVGAPPRPPRFYASGEYLLWWIKGDNVPPLATTSAPGDFGVLGAPSTTILFGNNALECGAPLRRTLHGRLLAG